MTWEALGVILGSVAAFATVVSVFAWVFWKRLAHLDREMRGDIRIPSRDKRALTGADTPEPWWAK